MCLGEVVMGKGEEITGLVLISTGVTARSAAGRVRTRTLTPSKEHSEGEERLHLSDSPGKGNQTISPLYQPLSSFTSPPLPVRGQRCSPPLGIRGDEEGVRMRPSPSPWGWEAMGIGAGKGKMKGKEEKLEER